jgi:hydrogenase maturation protein HypF
MMDPVSALYIRVKGVVQGVGFRPFVYGLATKLGLKGWVSNTTSGVAMEVEGPASILDTFLRDLVESAPPLSRIEHLESQPIPPKGRPRFEIRESQVEVGYVLVSPDVATCEECRSEVFDPEDRRYRYPFTNCTNCGPRFTIIADVPYDRRLTTMAPFTMCPACQSEYDDPLNRRFHAQPNACPVCGPRVWLAPSSAREQEAMAVPEGDPQNARTIEACAALLRSGAVLALKGLGGFHLACDATNPRAVQTLRERKRRSEKPLAVMMASLDKIHQHCVILVREQELLKSPACPIVLLEWRTESTVSRDVAPGNRYLGVMLPYTPLHHLLLDAVDRPLVMTSGNISEEPIAQNNEEAWNRLRPLADAFLFHNREIYARYDDSVWFAPALSDEKGETSPAGQPIRRSRGYAPYPLRLPFSSRPLLACGPELKNTFCFTREQYAFLGQHIGDMENLETLEHFETSIRVYERLFRLRPEALVRDLHPDYLSTRYAGERASREHLPLVGVQHHHAHAVSCMVDNGRTEPVIAVTLDGTGFGPDGTIWGGEWLVADVRGFHRVAWLEPLPLPGGDTGIRNPGRVAVAYLHRTLGHVPPLPFTLVMDEAEKKTVCAQVDKGINLARTSSCGRLFDAVAAIGGGRIRVTYEAQAAIEMEMVSQSVSEGYSYDLRSSNRSPEQSIQWGETGGLPSVRSTLEVGLKPLLTSVVEDVLQKKSLSDVGSKFHRGLATIMGEVCSLIAEQTGLKEIALSGGCFQNRLLLKTAVEELRKRGLRPLLHRNAPTNDGGISLGQAAIGHFSLT